MTGALRASAARNTQAESHYRKLFEWQSSLCFTIHYLLCLAKDLYPLSIIPATQQICQTFFSLTVVTSKSPISGFILFPFYTAKWNICYLEASD